MNYISTTGLRTQSSELVDALLAGRTVDLFHRSKLMGEWYQLKPRQKQKSFYELIMSLPKSKGLTQKSDEGLP